MADDFSTLTTGLDDPGRGSAAVTPHDSNELDPIPRAIYIGSGGNLSMRLLDDTGNVSWVGVPTGTVLKVRPKLIRNTGTTASSLVAIY